MATQRFNIVGGPNGEDLLGCHQFGKDVVFTVEPLEANGKPLFCNKMKVRWICKSAEDGSSKNWMVDFFTDVVLYYGSDVESAPQRRKLHGYYNTDRRTGWLEFVEDELSALIGKIGDEMKTSKDPNFQSILRAIMILMLARDDWKDGNFDGAHEQLIGFCDVHDPQILEGLKQAWEYAFARMR
jgi:hypothetical protein